MQSRSRLRVQDDMNENRTLHPIALPENLCVLSSAVARLYMQSNATNKGRAPWPTPL